MPNATIEVMNDLTQSSWSVNLDEDMIRFLRQPTMKGASRLDAYFYLLKKCLNTPTTTKPVFEDEIKLEPYQIVVVITELAEKWNWSRETVRKFLDRLEKFGLLKKHQLDRCSVLTMTVTSNYKASCEANESDVDGEDKTSAEMNENEHKSR